MAVHNVYLSPYSARDRRELLKQIERDLQTGAGPTIVVGDFNIAPRPEDGMFGTAPSTFTSTGERLALASLLMSGVLFDATCPPDGVPADFTFERLARGKPSNFRCDLALVSESLREYVTVEYDHSVRKSADGFTDHSALIIDLVGWPKQNLAILPARHKNETSSRSTENATRGLARASHKTAIKRGQPSQIARTLLAQGVLADLGAKSILDFGCGYGVDVEFYRSNGFEANGYDIEPRFGFADMPDRLYDLVTVVYVVNVLPTVEDRLAATRNAARNMKPSGHMFLAARSESAIAKEAERGHWEAFNDGWISSSEKGTFQKGIRREELAWLLGMVGLEPCPSSLRFTADVAWMLGRNG
jgi:2-polyprenyl-3-methyl-5-hydroxy-6-metoxy-1,4-benzoquinol methylase